MITQKTHAFTGLEAKCTRKESRQSHVMLGKPRPDCDSAEAALATEKKQK